MSSINPKHLILKFLLANEGDPLSARDAILACGLFGIRDNSVRVALARLAAAGLIEAAGRGTYQLGPNATGLAEDVSTWRSAEHRVREWGGAWICAHCGALGRSDRSALAKRARALQLLGFRELDDELFVRPDNLIGGVIAVRERLHKLGLAVTAAVFLASQFDEARETRARQLWDGKSLTHAYRATREKLEQWLARADELEPDVAARESFLIGDAAIRLMVFDPLLPAPLVDTAARRACAEAVQHFDETGHVIWRRLHATNAATDKPTHITLN